MDFDGVAAHDPIAVADEPREAAVVVPVVARPDRATDAEDRSREDPSGEGDCAGDYHVLFTKRADDLQDHPGQMSFPGGGREPADADLLGTALREAEEEVGLDPRAVDVVGRLDDIRTTSRYSVRPFVARIPDREYRPADEREVAEVVVLPVDGLTDLDNYESERRDRPHYGDVRLHFFHVDGYTVWGATARMLVQFLELATDWEMPPEPDRYADPDDDLPERVRDQVR